MFHIGGLYTVTVVHYVGCPTYQTTGSGEHACMHLTGTRQTLNLVQENAFLPAAARPLHLRSLEEFVYRVHSTQSDTGYVSDTHY